MERNVLSTVDVARGIPFFNSPLSIDDFSSCISSVFDIFAKTPINKGKIYYQPFSDHPRFVWERDANGNRNTRMKFGAVNYGGSDQRAKGYTFESTVNNCERKCEWSCLNILTTVKGEDRLDTFLTGKSIYLGISPNIYILPSCYDSLLTPSVLFLSAGNVQACQ